MNTGKSTAGAKTRSLPDGLEALRRELDIRDIMRLIERTAKWVDPATFRLLPVWFPEHARKGHLYNANWTEPRLLNKETHKREGNTQANKALTLALGLRKGTRPNWTCCHIWGVDDDRYQKANAVVQDHRFFSCVANMVLLPSPLKAFTDTMVDVKAMLRICARNLFGWQCDHDSVSDAVLTIDEWNEWDAYPASWPKSGCGGMPVGVMELNENIRASAKNRLKRIQIDLEHAGPYYPSEEVRAALEYWNVDIN